MVIEIRQRSNHNKIVSWLKTNLFSSITNTVLTILAMIFLLVTLLPLINWAILDAIWSGESGQICRQTDGACWIFIKSRWDQLMYGFYPESERWRVNFAGIFTLLHIGIAIFTSLKRNKWFWLWSIIIAPVLIWNFLLGGILFLEKVPTDKWGGLFLTFVVSGAGILTSLPIGTILALGRRSQMPLVRWTSIAFIELWRGVPLITVLFMSSVMLPMFLPPDFHFDKLLRALIAVSLFSSAYMAEVIRGGILAIPKGQYEASDALGFNYQQKIQYIILPQAIKHVIPGIVNTFIGLFKDTTLVAIIGMFDLLGVVKSSLTDPEWLGFSKEGYIFAGFCFWIICWSMSQYSYKLEFNLSKGKNH